MRPAIHMLNIYRHSRNWSICSVAILALSIILGSIATVRAETKISSKLVPPKISLNDNATLEITIISDVQNVPTPQLPPITDFQVFSSGRSQSVQVMNGKVNATVIYKFVLAPRQPGTFVVGPATVKVGPKTYSSESHTIVVDTSTIPHSAVPSTKPDPGQAKLTRDRRVFITADLDRDTAYVNQPITFIFRFYSGERLLSNPEYQRPAFTGFWVEDLPPQRKYSTTVEGVTYDVTEIRTALFPAESGTKTIPAAEVNATVRSARRNKGRANPFNLFDESFFDRGETVRLTTKALQLVVLPLPPTQITPAPSGLVGEFEIRANADVRQVNVGDPITVSVTITGEGNVKSIPVPYRDTLPNFRMFSGGTSENITTADYRIRGSKTFDEVFVPQRAGTYSIPSFAVTYFDPKKREHQTARTAPIEITVTGGAADFTIPSLKLEPDQLSDLAADVRFLKTEGDDLRRVSSPGLFGLAFWAGHVIPLLGLIGFLTWRRGVIKEASDPVGRRRRLARQVATSRLHREGAAAESGLTYVDLAEILMQFYNDRFNKSAQGQTRNEIRATLLSNGVPNDAVKSYIDLLDECDRGRYAAVGMDKVSPTTVAHAESVIASLAGEK